MCYWVGRTSIGYCSPSMVCSEPRTPFVPQCRWNWRGLYVSSRFPPDTVAGGFMATSTGMEKTTCQYLHSWSWASACLQSVVLLVWLFFLTVLSNKVLYPVKLKAADASPVGLPLSLCWRAIVCFLHNFCLFHSSSLDLKATWRC